MDYFAPDQRLTLADLIASPLGPYELIDGALHPKYGGPSIQLPEGVRYTVDEFLALPENGYFELLRGKLRKLPRPILTHSRVLQDLCYPLMDPLDGMGVYWLAFPVYVMPFAAPETPYDAIDTVLEPDFCAIRDRSRVSDDGCFGPPELVAEILSPGAEDFDFGEKLDLYAAAGVQEYWIANPGRRELTVCRLERGQYRRQVYRAGKVPVAVFPPLEADLDRAFRRCPNENE